MSDVDGDGVEDADDSCLEEAEDRDGYQDEDGCPDPDNDGDGVLDAADQCASDAEDMDGHEDGDGCPDADNDGDGRPDADDACPDAAEDADQFEDEDGCPDPDNDRDGVADADDQCADGAETINGVTDDDGCPDRGGRALWRIQGAGTAEEQLTGSIAFDAEHAVRDRSNGAVEQLARLLIARWPHRYRVQIAAGDDARAQALTAALTQHGVPSARVQVVAGEAIRAARVVVVREVEEEDSPQPTGEEPGPDSGE